MITSMAMAPFRQLQYDYYRKGLDEMANNVERGRTEIYPFRLIFSNMLSTLLIRLVIWCIGL